MKNAVAFSILLFLLLIKMALSATEIVIEYNVTSECSGNVVLTLNPQTVLRGGSVIASASNLSTCDAKIVYFRNSSCTGATVVSCPVSGSGCSAPAFNAPSSEGSYTFYACIDKNDNDNFNDAGEANSKILSVESSTPSVGSLIFSMPSVDLSANNKKNINISSTITNADGCGNISSCSGYLWSSNVTPPYTEAKATYTNSSCLLSGTTCSCICEFNLWYYDLAGTWTANITAKTPSKSGSNQGSFTVNPLASLDISPSSITFADLKVGDVNKPALNNPLKIKNTGNAKLKVSIYGENHKGEENSSWVISVGNMTYNSTVSGMTALRNLNKTPTNFYPLGGVPVYPNSVSGITEKATFYIYNYLSIPLGFKAQKYNTTYYVDASAV